MKVPEELRDLRYSHKGSGNNGLFYVPSPIGSYTLTVIASDGMGWDHVSVSLPRRCPNWAEMQYVKELFFHGTETVVQFHPRKDEYVNNHPYCLHLWKNQESSFDLPPSILTGIKDELKTIG